MLIKNVSLAVALSISTVVTACSGSSSAPTGAQTGGTGTAGAVVGGAGKGGADVGGGGILDVAGGDAGAGTGTGGAGGLVEGALPKRLTIAGQKLLDAAGNEVGLHGANLQDNLLGADGSGKQTSVPIVTAAEATDFAVTLGLNFARLRISFEGINRVDGDPTNLSPDVRQKIDDAVDLLSAQHVWVLLEMRADDATANSAAFYQPGSTDFKAYDKAWNYLSQHYNNVDYIAGYGILAEPSPDKAYGDDAVVGTLVTFQNALIDTISVNDTRTPIFLGPAFNYDTMGYRWDAYATGFPKYQGRLVYEVNVLIPKPWIESGLDPSNASLNYPVLPAASDFSSLLTVAPGERFTMPLDNERIFGARRDEPTNVPKLMSQAFLAWYLGFAGTFAKKWSVPMVVDQFGASTAAAAAGQLAYEQDLINTAEADGIGWCRWTYNAYKGPEQLRDIEHNPPVHAFYAAKPGTRPGP